MKQVRVHYSNEFKIKAVELSNQSGVKEVGEQLKVNLATLHFWRKLHRDGKLKLEPGVKEKQKSKEELENVQLKKELYEVKQERDILKKALGIFSKSDR